MHSLAVAAVGTGGNFLPVHSVARCFVARCCVSEPRLLLLVTLLFLSLSVQFSNSTFGVNCYYYSPSAALSAVFVDANLSTDAALLLNETRAQYPRSPPSRCWPTLNCEQFAFSDYEQEQYAACEAAQAVMDEFKAQIPFGADYDYWLNAVKLDGPARAEFTKLAPLATYCTRYYCYDCISSYLPSAAIRFDRVDFRAQQLAVEFATPVS